LALLAWWSWPYVRFPTLLKMGGTVSMALGDTATAALIRARTGLDIFGLDRPPGWVGRPPRPPLCTMAQLSSQDPVTGACLVWRDTLVPGCENQRFCAEIEFHPSVLSDPRLRAVLDQAIQNPCQALPDLDPGAPRSSLSGIMFLGLSVDRRILRCGRLGEVHGRVVASDPKAGRVRIRF
jgi:hypothetical protein